MNEAAIEKSVEVICNKGCQQVNLVIQALERGDKTGEVQSLSQHERHQVLNELKSIMNVYGGICRIS